MRSVIRLAAIVGGLALLGGCAMQEKKTLESLKEPINCATAEGDLRVLQGEKAHVGQQIASGLTAIAPAGLVMGVLTGTESTKLRVAAGDYNTQIDQKIAAIKSTCNI